MHRGYAPVAEELFGRAAVNASFLEYDSERAGDFAPLAAVPANKRVAPGLVSTKTPATPSADDLMRRLEAAAHHVPLDRLALSPQCGFASSVGGNPITLADERRKRALVAEVARRVWGSPTALAGRRRALLFLELYKSEPLHGVDAAACRPAAADGTGVVREFVLAWRRTQPPGAACHRGARTPCMTTGRLRATERPLDAIDAKPLRLLYEYWREVAAGRPFVLNSELRPERFAPALPHIAIIEQAVEPRRGLRIRLCGSDVENRDFGIVRGAFLEDARPDWYRDHLAAEVAAAMARGAPIHQRVAAELDDKRFEFTRLMLPLSSAGASCDMLMVAAVRPSDRIVDAMRARLSMA